jgi:metal-dependent amidase/aminoacylase/carboxypeptidase family protein
MIHGGETFNVIPPEVKMEGTIRTFEPAVRETVLRRFDEIVKGGRCDGLQRRVSQAPDPAMINATRSPGVWRPPAKPAGGCGLPLT